MRASWASETRIDEVRRAAKAWRAAGAIDAKTLWAIEVAYPEPRPRLAPAWRVLIFFLVTVAIGAVFAGIAFASSDAATAFAIVFGALLAFATEILRDSRLAGNGSDAATSFSAIVYLLLGIGLAWVQFQHASGEAVIMSLLALAAVFFAAACVHWGFEAYGALAAASLFLLLGRAPAGRVWWIVGGAVLAVLAYARLDRPYPPPLRRAVGGVLAVSAAALYVAVNRYSLDEGWIEELRAGYSTPGPATEILDLFSSAATALLPIVFLWWGVRARRALLLDLGLLFAAASIVTLRFYVHLAPLWTLLAAAGAALVLVSLWLNRFLREAPGGERRGFTSAPLFADRRDALQAAAVIAGFTGSPAAPKSGEISTGGGRFGGGGSSADF